jgi:hypothetical protein
MTQEPAPLPLRDFSDELAKTAGSARALELALEALAGNEHLVNDRDNPSVQGVLALIRVLADRLDDLVHMNDEVKRIAAARQPPSN